MKHTSLSTVMTGALVTCVFGASSPVHADTFRQRAGAYADNQGTQRERLQLDGSVDAGGFAPAMTASSLAATWTREFTRLGEDAITQYDSDVYGTERRTDDGVNLTFGQVWNRLSDSRVGVGWRSDGVVTSRTAGIGGGSWFFGETFQASIDLTRSLTDRPRYPILDYDFAVVDPPTRVDSTGVSLALRQLVSPTLVVLAGGSNFTTSDRPPLRTLSLGARQYFPSLHGALHPTVVRAINRGRVTTDTNYGEVDAWQVDLAWLQQISRQTRGKVSWRWYREDETTRAYGDELTFGSDLVSVGLARALPKGFRGGAPGKGIDAPLTVEVNASRYRTNANILAQVIEAGVSTSF